ncbi:radical SAM/SPASM domain-containing protein [Neofamilia massiliensis]|uniref:radical SAM/SPASM domain-containing protein n=1 Tax=Neofamilia massiliensis TaxID=1673724 RepID=UPI0006BB939F|nr:radical SAM protein [Neofamilia massiliensis]
MNFLKSRRLHRLEFIVANYCNLSCKYCYADSGTYNQNKRYIDKKTIDNTFKYLFVNIDVIEEILLFGGEPLLAVEQVKYICELFYTFKQSRPIIKLVTNLTILNEEIIKIINKYNIQITVSLDGPKSINDSQRYFHNSSRSVYDAVETNINTLNKYNINPNSIECTYTKETRRIYSRQEIAQYFFSKFKNIDVIQICNEHSCFRDLVEANYIFVRDINLDEKSLNRAIIKNNIINNKNRKYPKICNAGKNIISVFSNGDIYPCHFFINIIDPIGNMDMEFKQLNNNFREYYFYTEKIRSHLFKNCNSCASVANCIICVGALESEKHKTNNSYENILSEFCDGLNKDIEEILNNC